MAPLGRAEEVLNAMLRLVRPGGVIVPKDPASASWTFEPVAQGLVAAIVGAFTRSGGEHSVVPKIS